MAPKQKKRKQNDTDDDWKETKKKKTVQGEGICIIHMDESKMDGFTYLTSKNRTTMVEKLRKIAEKRLGQEFGSVHRMEKISQDFLTNIQSIAETTHGYHRDCYQRFTGNMNRLKEVVSDPSSSPNVEPRRSERKSSEGEKIIFKPDCIFCNREGKISVVKDGVKTTQGVSGFNQGGGPHIFVHAEHIGDTNLLTRIRGYNLFSCEAKYHPHCREKYLNTKRDTSSRRVMEVNKTIQVQMEEAHQHAYHSVQDVIKAEVIHKQIIVRFYVLLGVYRDKLKGTQFENNKYRAEKLFKKLKKDDSLSTEVSFCFPQKGSKQFETCLLYSQRMKMDDAVRASFELGMALANKVKETALEIRGEVLNAFKKFSKIEKWPPMPNTIPDCHDLVPIPLQNLIKILICGSDHSKSEKTSRLVYSISQDICRAVTNGKWNLPKHILLGMALRHLFRSAELTVILNRFGHIPDYCFLLELESALAKAMDESSHLLTNSIIRNASCKTVFHSDFDNFDQYTNELTGAGSVHRAHGIMLQELLPEANELVGGNIPDIIPQKKTKNRSYKFQLSKPVEDQPYMGIRNNPSLEINTTTISGGEDQQNIMLFEGFIWVFLRLASVEGGTQECPGWSGYVSLLGTVPTRLTTIDYYPVIPYPITDYSTVVETLRYAKEAGEEVGQDYHFVTYDLGVCLKAFPLIWNHPVKYKKHILLIGTFHIVCAYLKMLAKKMKGSGFSDILIESGLMTSGSMVSVLSGKGYSRAMNCHKSLLEGLERLLMLKFFIMEDDNMELMIEKAKQQVLIHKTKPNADLKTLVSNKDVSDLISGFTQFRQKVKNGLLGVTARMWLSYMDHVWLILSLLHAVKTNNYKEYAHCMTLLPDLFFAFGGQNYARYLTYFGVFLANIDHSHPGASELIKQGVFSVARSFVPGSRSATDKTIEETFMKHSKSRGGSGGAGMIGILNNPGAYQRWCTTASERVKYYQATLQMAGMEPDKSKSNDKHKDTRSSEMKKSEEFIKQVIETITDYGNPFDMSDKSKLYCLSSGCSVAEDVMNDVLSVETMGREAKLVFIKDRLGKENEQKKGSNGEGVFFDTIKKMKLKTMATDNTKVTLTKSDNKKVSYQQDGSFVFNLLLQLQKLGPDVIDLRVFVSYPLTPIIYSIGTVDGYLAKTNKSKGFQWLTKNIVNASFPQSTEKTVVIEDGNAIFHCLTDLPGTFKEISERTFDMMSKCKIVIFSTDMYKALSVKTMERVRRGTSNKLLVGGPKTKKPVEWKEFLKNSDNKMRFIEILLEVWSSKQFATRLESKEVTLICEGKAYKLSYGNNEVTKTALPEIESDQEETDTRVILYCFYARTKGFKNVVVRSPDSDIFFILLNYIHDLDGITVFFETGKKNKKRLINMTKLTEHYSDEYCKALLGLHAFTGCDSTSAFKGKGKVRAIRCMLKDSIILKASAKLGIEWTLTDEVIIGMERLTCRLYGASKVNDVNECRYVKLTSVCCPDNLNMINPTKKFDTAFIPPPKVSFLEHCKRVNFEVGKWKRSHEQFPIIPSPFDDNGWSQDLNGFLQPTWYKGDMLPQSIINELPTESENNESEEKDEDVEEDVEADDTDYTDYSDFIAELFNEDDDEEEFDGFSSDDD